MPASTTSATRSHAFAARKRELFDGATRAGCYRWLGKAVAVLIDGAFERQGCPMLERTDARRSCLAGARELEDALVTFS